MTEDKLYRWVNAFDRQPFNQSKTLSLKLEGVPRHGNFYNNNDGIFFDIVFVFGSNRIYQSDFGRIDWLEEYTPEQTSNWISVRDQLPDKGQQVILWINEGVNLPVKHIYNGQKWFSLEKLNLPEYYEVEFWQPLPSPPKN